MAYSLAWMVSDILKSVLSLFQMSWSLYQLSYSVQPNARMIQYSVLVTSSVGIAFSAGSHEPGYAGWRFYLTGISTWILFSELTAIFISLKITEAGFSAKRLGLPPWTRKLFISYGTITTILMTISLVAVHVTNELSWAAPRTCTVFFLMCTVGIHFEKNLFHLRIRFLESSLKSHAHSNMSKEKGERRSHGSRQQANRTPPNIAKPAGNDSFCEAAETQVSLPNAKLPEEIVMTGSPMRSMRATRLAHERGGNGSFDSGAQTQTEALSSAAPAPISPRKKALTMSSPMKTQNSLRIPDNPSPIQKSMSGKLASSGVGALSSHLSNPHVINVRSDEKGESFRGRAIRALTNNRASMIQLKKAGATVAVNWIRKIDRLIIGTGILILLLIPASFYLMVILVLSEESFSESADNESTNYSFFSDFFFWSTIAINFVYLYYVYSKRSNYQKTPVGSAQ